MTAAAFDEDSLVQANVISRKLVSLTKVILENVLRSSEEAVLQISEKIQGMGSLTEEQKSNLRDAFEGYYHGSEGEEMKRVLNETASKIADAAAEGNLEEIERLSSDPAYQAASKGTKKLHDALQVYLHGEDAMSEYIMPTLISLQFHDRMRQDIEALMKTYDSYFAFVIQSVGSAAAESEPSEQFWHSVAKNFTSIEAREVVLKTAFGDDYQINETDVRAKS